MQELSIWIVVGIVWFFILAKLLNSKSDDPVGQSIVVLGGAALYVIPAIIRFVWLLVASWF